MSSKKNRRSQSVENKQESDGDNLGDSNRHLYKSASNHNLKPYGSTFKGKSSVLNRPGTIAALSSLSLGGFSQNISANTLRNAHSQWSFAKADRFRKLRIDNSAQMLMLPTTLNAKTSTFGFGNKKPLQIIFGKDSPAPSMYRCRSQFDFHPNKGKSIGEPYSAYKKVHMPGLNTRLDEIPGPGSYDQKTTIGANSRKFTLKSRISMPGPSANDNNYHPTHRLVEESRFDKITFGFGGRPNVTGRINENPGPGTYKIPSVFDKFKKIPNSSLLKTLEKYRKSTRRKISQPTMSQRTGSISNRDSDAPEPLAIANDMNQQESNPDKDSVTDGDL